MKVVVTGSSGFVGTHLVHALRGLDGIEVCPLKRGVQSLSDSESLKPLLENSRVVFHLAGANRASPHELIEVNLVGTLNVLEAMRHAAGTETKLVFLSSFQVYRSTPEPVEINESVPLAPETLYGISKKMAEELISFYGFPSIIFRPSNIYGPRCRPYYNSVVSTFCDLMVKGSPLTLNGTGEQARDFLYVDDVIRAMVKAVEYSAQGVEVFNLCSGRLASLNEVIATLMNISGSKSEMVKNVIPQDYRFLKGSNRKAREVLNWSPEIDLAEGLELTYRWFERGGR